MNLLQAIDVPAALRRWSRARPAGQARSSFHLAMRILPRQRHIDVFALARADFDAVIDGMLMDAQPEPVRAPPAAVLDLYCDRVASAVGRLSVKVGKLERVGILLRHALV